MSSFIRLLQLRFLPHSADLGLLVLRVWFGASLLLLHGWGKLTSFSTTAEKFPNVFAPYLEVSGQINLAMALGGEVLGAALLILGLFARLGALLCAATMAGAFFVVHNGLLKGEGNGELAFIYLGAFVALFLAGPGRFSLDAAIGRGPVR